MRQSPEAANLLLTAPLSCPGAGPQGSREVGKRREDSRLAGVQASQKRLIILAFQLF